VSRSQGGVRSRILRPPPGESDMAEDGGGGGPGGGPTLSSSKWLLCVGAVLMMLAISDLMVPGMQAEAQQQPSTASSKQPKFASKAFVGPTIKFLYCYS